MYLETTDDEDMGSSNQPPGSGKEPSLATTGNASIPARGMSALSGVINSLFGGLYGPETSTQSHQEREDDLAQDSTVEIRGGKAKYYQRVSVEELEKRIRGLKKRLKGDPPEDMKKVIPVLIEELEAELTKRRC